MIALGRAVRACVVGAGFGWSGALGAYHLSRLVMRQRRGWIEFADDLAPWFYAPAPAVTLAGLALGSRPLTAAGLTVAALFGQRWGRRFGSTRGKPPAQHPDLVVMTFNTLAWQRDGHDLARSIEAAAPDLVGMQEIGKHAARYLIQRLADVLPYHAESASPDASGSLVLSRYPVHDATAFRGSEHGHWWQQMTVETPDGPVRYINLHLKIPFVRYSRCCLGKLRIPLEFNAERRRLEVERLIALLDADSGPTIVTGDFNMTERSPDHAMLATRLTDAYFTVGRGFGLTFPRLGAFPRAFPSPWPLVRLDYVWHSRHFRAVSAVVGDSGRSDHHPIVASLVWSERAHRAATPTTNGVAAGAESALHGAASL